MRINGTYGSLTGEKDLQYSETQNLKFDADYTQGSVLFRITARGSKTRFAALKKVNLSFLAG